MIRGGVEDTTLEAKAKDAKKNPRPRTRTALPRTDPFEAKDRNARGQDQGHRRKCSKKKVFKNFLSDDLQKRKTKKVFAYFPRGF